MNSNYSELILTVYVSLAQYESYQISENVKWGLQRKMEKGNFSLPYSRFLGYKKGNNDRPTIKKREASIVREIYTLFLGGVNINSICSYLMRLKRKSPSKSYAWHGSTVLSILTNEKYAGIALLQKTYVKDYLDHRSINNRGERRMFLITNSHEPIVPPEVFLEVQVELIKRGYKPKNSHIINLLIERLSNTASNLPSKK